MTAASDLVLDPNTVFARLASDGITTTEYVYNFCHIVPPKNWVCATNFHPNCSRKSRPYSTHLIIRQSSRQAFTKRYVCGSGQPQSILLRMHTETCTCSPRINLTGGWAHLWNIGVVCESFPPPLSFIILERWQPEQLMRSYDPWSGNPWLTFLIY